MNFEDEESLTKTISCGYSEKVWNEIKSKNDIENIKWDKMNILSKKNGNYNDFEYYLKSTKMGSQHKTLIIGIFILNKQKNTRTSSRKYFKNTFK